MLFTKTIIIAGDSHTWGQGVGGESCFQPPVVGGELRLMPFLYPTYGNLIRKAINDKTNSTAEEMELHACSIFSLRRKAGLYRIEFYAKTEAVAEILLDNVLAATIPLSCTDRKYSYTIFPFFCDQTNEHELQIHICSGEAEIYRIEIYSGSYAVINAGIGSCPLKRYLHEYWENYVAAYHPYLIVAEGNTINDWLTKETPLEYANWLSQFIKAVQKLGISCIFHTVAPIAGAQAEPYNSYAYPEFIETVRKITREKKYPLVDTNAIMKKELEKGEVLFADNWHVNEKGHSIYAREILHILQNFL